MYEGRCEEGVGVLRVKGQSLASMGGGKREVGHVEAGKRQRGMDLGVVGMQFEGFAQILQCRLGITRTEEELSEGAEDRGLVVGLRQQAGERRGSLRDIALDLECQR